jgi:hypothetical protein
MLKKVLIDRIPKRVQNKIDAFLRDWVMYFFPDWQTIIVENPVKVKFRRDMPYTGFPDVVSDYFRTMALRSGI